MAEPLMLVALILLVLWTFWSGFTDASNSISTIVGTRVLIPLQAVSLAAFGNLLGIFFGEPVARTLGKGIVNVELMSGLLVISALAGGFVWEIITYWRGLPISETQVLVGALLGAGLAAGGVEAVQFGSISRVLTGMVSSPPIAFAFGLLFVGAVIRGSSRFASPRLLSPWFRRLQIFSSFSFSVSHGTNDAQKSAGVIAGLLVFYGLEEGFAVPLWVKLVAFAALSLGTFFGGWRIVRTMGFRLTNLQPFQGFCAETGAAIVVGAASQIGLPISTSQTVSGSIMGVGTSKRLSAVRWGVAREVVLGWLLTLPMSILFAFIAYTMFDTIL